MNFLELHKELWALGTDLAKDGQKVLLIDLDAQSNLTMSFGFQSPDEIPVTIDGQSAERVLRDIFLKLMTANLASTMSNVEEMWGGTWEMDGNTGITSAICEMLVQSQDNEIRLLPALPAL